MPITVALTNYNAEDHIVRIIPQLRAHGFDHIVVLDDASTDGSVAYLEQQADVELVKGETNLGPTGNKNRILKVDTRELILFLDVDMELLGFNAAAKTEKEFAGNPGAGVIGALVLGSVSQPSFNNWGYDLTPYREGFAEALILIAGEHSNNTSVMATVRRMAAGKVACFEPVVSRNVDWVFERFFCVRADIFRQLGGFDANFRWFHEGPDYCRRVRQAGYIVHFTTNITARHLDLASGDTEQRAKDRTASSLHYFQKHYGLSDLQCAQVFWGP